MGDPGLYECYTFVMGQRAARTRHHLSRVRGAETGQKERLIGCTGLNGVAVTPGGGPRSGGEFFHAKGHRLVLIPTEIEAGAGGLATGVVAVGTISFQVGAGTGIEVARRGVVPYR